MKIYEDLTKLQVNCEEPRAHYIPYDTLEKALRGDRKKSMYYKCLNSASGTLNITIRIMRKI